jgi:hypothetical protein
MENYTEKEVNKFGDKRYYNSKGRKHRVDGPAVEYTDGTKIWYLNGRLHRIDGPAGVWSDGDKFWFLKGRRYTKSCHNRLCLFSVLEP